MTTNTHVSSTTGKVLFTTLKADSKSDFLNLLAMAKVVRISVPWTEEAVKVSKKEAKALADKFDYSKAHIWMSTDYLSLYIG